MVIFTGYIGMSFGVLKIFWRQFGVHFYAPGVAHAPHAEVYFDSVLIFLIILAGACLVVFRMVIPALLTLIALFFYEFMFLHHDPHTFIQTSFAIGSIVGQIITLAVYIVGYTEFGKATTRQSPRYPSARGPNW